MYEELLKNKSKPMIPSICLQNVDDISPDTTTSISRNLYGKSPTTLLSALFRSDPPSPNNNKIDKKLVGEFL